MIFCLRGYEHVRYKTNEIINTFLCAEDKFIPELHLKQLEFIDSACGPFNKNKEAIEKSEETGDSR